MRRPALILLTVMLTAIVYGQKNITGEYVTNFPTYGMFASTLKLNCDSTAVLNFQGDMINDNSYGLWTIHNKTLTVFFDTAKPNARYKDTLSFTIKGKRLYRAGWTKATYDKYKTLLDQHKKETGENLQLPSYKEFNRTYNRTPKNYYGKTGKQYFKKSKDYSCNKTQLSSITVLQKLG